MRFRFHSTVGAVAPSLLLLGMALSSNAHVVLEDQAALAGSSYKAVFRVGHSCPGAATTGITVRLPAGFEGAKPMPKAGWNLETWLAPLAQPYINHGETITEDVAEVRWTVKNAADALPDGWYDEFVLRGTLPKTAGALWFKVLQTCTQGQLDWAEIPASGTSTKGIKAPAALLEVLPSGPQQGHSH